LSGLGVIAIVHLVYIRSNPHVSTQLTTTRVKARITQILKPLIFGYGIALKAAEFGGKGHHV